MTYVRIWGFLDGLLNRRTCLAVAANASPQKASAAMIQGDGERISSLPSAAAADFPKNGQEHHDQERPNADRRPICFVAIPRKGGQ